MRRLQLFRLTLACLVLASIAGPTPAHADGYYVDFGGGLSSMGSAKPFFNTSDSDLSGVSGYLNAGTNFTSATDFFGFGVALNNRISTGSSLMLAGLYPSLRLEIWNLGLTAGYTPFVWATAAENGFHRRQGATAMLFEAYVLVPITPEIDFMAQASQQRVSSGPETLDYGIGFRLNFGLGDGEKKARHKFRGWRYPFGREIN